ncbi:hypothetical protein BASA81_000714 [Batrachochytrium salamandrivorans]|nr:hypothetical protein BASA81_000714 [Batrachochytrium salamandrivorans]
MAHQKNSRSLKVFRPFIKRLADGTLDVSGVISRDCYEQWMHARHAVETDDEAQKFHRTLTNHVSGTHLGRRHRAMGHHEKQKISTVEGAYIPLPAIMLEPISPTITARSSLPQPNQYQQQQQQPLLDWLDLPEIKEEDDLGKMLQQLDSDDASYLTQLAEHVVRNFAGEYSAKDRQAIDDIFRFMILGRTKRCCQDLLVSPKATANQLCRDFAHTEDTLVFVCDFAANNQDERVLAQNFGCDWAMGKLEGRCATDSIHQHDLFRVLVAIGGAFHQPSIPFTVARQQLFNTSTLQNRQVDMTYIVDPSSFLLVGFGVLS